MISGFSFALLLPEIFIFFLALFLVFGVLYLNVEKTIEGGKRSPLINNSIFSLVTIGLLLTLNLLLESPFNYTTFFGTLVSFSLVTKMKLLVVFIAIFLVQILKYNSKFEKVQSFEIGVLLTLSVGGLFLLMSANDLVLFYLALEHKV